MKYCVCPSYIWTYPDIHSYPQSCDKGELYALKGGFATCQIHIFDTEEERLCLFVEGGEWEAYQMLPIPVEACPGISEPLLHFPEREAPFSVFDCLKPCTGEIECTEGATGLYFAFPVSEDAEGDIACTIRLKGEKEEADIPIHIRVSSASVPEELLEIAMGCDFYRMTQCHSPSTREDYERLQTEYLELLRRQHQTAAYIDPPRRRFENGKWSFDYRGFNHFAKKALSMGFRNLMIHGVGFRRSWDAPDIYCGDIDLLSYEGYKYLEEYLGSLRKNLENEGWLNSDIFRLGLCDEPNRENAMTYRALAGMVRKLIPELKLYDATSGAPIYGSIDIYIPRADEYEKHREMFDHYREKGDGVWHYVCLYPREGGYINRFLDIPLLATRYLFWGNYRYGLSGYVHWTVNSYQDECDPFKTSCPRHINAGSESILPPGDDKLIYPGGDDHPWMSIRLENHRESAEEYAMLMCVARVDKPLADSICNKVFRSFCDTELDPLSFEKAREELIRAYERVTAEGPVL